MFLFFPSRDFFPWVRYFVKFINAFKESSMSFKWFQGFSGFQNISAWKIYTWKALLDFADWKYSCNSQIPLDSLVIEFKFVLHLPFCFPSAKYKPSTLVWHSGSYLPESVTSPILFPPGAATLTHSPCLFHLWPGLFQEPPRWLTAPGTPSLVIFIQNGPIETSVKSCHSLELKWLPISFRVKANVLIVAKGFHVIWPFFLLPPNPFLPLSLCSSYTNFLLFLDYS